MVDRWRRKTNFYSIFAPFFGVGHLFLFLLYKKKGKITGGSKFYLYYINFFPLDYHLLLVLPPLARGYVDDDDDDILPPLVRGYVDDDDDSFRLLRTQ